MTTSIAGPDRIVLTVRGELDLACPATVLAALHQASGSGRHLVIDLQALRFMDSSGLLQLITCERRTTDRGRSCVVVCPAGPVLRVIELTGLLDTFDVQETLAGAEALLEAREGAADPVGAAAGPRAGAG